MSAVADAAAPARDTAPACGLNDCTQTACQSDPHPCGEWMDVVDETGEWCPRCGWNEAAHTPAPRDELADLRVRHATVLAYLDQRAGTPGAGPTVPADLIRAMLTEETPA